MSLLLLLRPSKSSAATDTRPRGRSNQAGPSVGGKTKLRRDFFENPYSWIERKRKEEEDRKALEALEKELESGAIADNEAAALEIAANLLADIQIRQLREKEAARLRGIIEAERERKRQR